MMPLPSPPGWLKNWRTDPAATILGSILLGGVAVGVIQFRSAAQIQQIRTENARERAESDRRFEEVRAVLARLGKTVPSDQHSDLAAESGRKAINEGRWGAGQIYLINAITNEPHNVEHLRTYTKAVLAHERPPEEALDQLGSILQMAACHVAPEHVPIVLARIEEVEQARARLKGDEPAGSPPSLAPAADGLDAEWARLKGAPDDLHRDPVRLAGHLRALENFAGTLDDQDRPVADPLTGQVAAEIRRWTEVAQAARNVAYVDQCLGKLTDEALKQTDNDRAVAIVQAAEAVLPSFWGIPPDALPADLQREINEYPGKIKTRVEAISLKKSADLMKQIEVALGSKMETRSIPETQGKVGPIEQSCRDVQEQVKRAQVLAAQLPSPSQILKAQEAIELRMQKLQRSRNEQYTKFQAEVIRRCNGAFDDYQTYRTGLSETDALKVLHDNRLQQIDQALLSPEVSRLFSDMLGKLMVELGPVKLVQTEGEMSSAKKIKLEDF